MRKPGLTDAKIASPGFSLFAVAFIESRVKTKL
jgi:hypothetical protein